MKQLGMVVLILVLNAIVLVAPWAMLLDAWAMVGGASVVLFLVLASLFCLGDLLACPDVAAASPGSWTCDQRGIQLRAHAFGATVLVIFWMALGQRAITNEHTGVPSLVVGGIVMLSGIALRQASIRVLGRHFITEVRVEPSRPLSRTGPFRLVRHPSELGNLLVTLGAVVLLGSSAGALVWGTVLVPLSIVRIRTEDRLLLKCRPREFLDHRRRIATLLPLVW